MVYIVLMRNAFPCTEKFSKCLFWYWINYSLPVRKEEKEKNHISSSRALQITIQSSLQSLKDCLKDGICCSDAKCIPLPWKIFEVPLPVLH